LTSTQSTNPKNPADDATTDLEKCPRETEGCIISVMLEWLEAYSTTQKRLIVEYMI
jgi:hypothetical protein